MTAGESFFIRKAASLSMMVPASMQLVRDRLPQRSCQMFALRWTFQLQRRSWTALRQLLRQGDADVDGDAGPEAALEGDLAGQTLQGSSHRRLDRSNLRLPLLKQQRPTISTRNQSLRSIYNQSTTSVTSKRLSIFTRLIDCAV